MRNIKNFFSEIYEDRQSKLLSKYIFLSEIASKLGGFLISFLIIEEFGFGVFADVFGITYILGLIFGFSVGFSRAYFRSSILGFKEESFRQGFLSLVICESFVQFIIAVFAIWFVVGFSNKLEVHWLSWMFFIIMFPFLSRINAVVKVLMKSHSEISWTGNVDFWFNSWRPFIIIFGFWFFKLDGYIVGLVMLEFLRLVLMLLVVDNTKWRFSVQNISSSWPKSRVLAMNSFGIAWLEKLVRIPFLLWLFSLDDKASVGQAALALQLLGCLGSVVAIAELVIFRKLVEQDLKNAVLIGARFVRYGIVAVCLGCACLYGGVLLLEYWFPRYVGCSDLLLALTPIGITLITKPVINAIGADSDVFAGIIMRGSAIVAFFGCVIAILGSAGISIFMFCALGASAVALANLIILWLSFNAQTLDGNECRKKFF